MPILACFILFCFTNSVLLILMQFMSIKDFNISKNLALVMEFARLWCLWIYFTLVISCCLYNWCKPIISIIHCFSYVVFHLTKQLYKNFKLVYKISKIIDLSIFFKVVFITALISNLWAISYSSAIKILHVTCSYFIKV